MGGELVIQLLRQKHDGKIARDQHKARDGQNGIARVPVQAEFFDGFRQLRAKERADTVENVHHADIARALCAVKIGDKGRDHVVEDTGGQVQRTECDHQQDIGRKCVDEKQQQCHEQRVNADHDTLREMVTPGDKEEGADKVGDIILHNGEHAHLTERERVKRGDLRQDGAEHGRNDGKQRHKNAKIDRCEQSILFILHKRLLNSVLKGRRPAGAYPKYGPAEVREGLLQEEKG